MTTAQTEARAIDALAEEMRAGLDGVTPGPWQVIVTEHPWTLAERVLLGHHLPAKSGNHIERRIFTTWDHPQAHAPDMVVNGAHGVGIESDAPVHFVSIGEADAAHIARCSPDNIRALLDDRATLTQENAELRAEVERLTGERLEQVEVWATFHDGKILSITVKEDVAAAWERAGLETRQLAALKQEAGR